MKSKTLTLKRYGEDVLNAIITDLVADQTIRALYLGYSKEDIEGAISRGFSHGEFEFTQEKLNAKR